MDAQGPVLGADLWDGEGDVDPVEGVERGDEGGDAVDADLDARGQWRKRARDGRQDGGITGGLGAEPVTEQATAGGGERGTQGDHAGEDEEAATVAGVRGVVVCGGGVGGVCGGVAVGGVEQAEQHEHAHDAGDDGGDCRNGAPEGTE